ncbi:MAG: TldD/PmbA family protein [Agathobacter sp.]|nr:TldD/PmbA family protein [Agathobacter sp.]
MNYQEFKNAVVKYATANEIKDYELYYTKSDETSVEIFQTEIKGFSSSNSLGICFRCVINGQTGYASTENMSDEEAESIVLRAIENAKSLESDAPAFIHKLGDTYATVEKEERTTPAASELVDFALDLQKEIYAQDERVIDGTQAVAACVSSEKAIFNSNGIDLADSASVEFCYAMAIVSDGTDMYDGMEIASGKMANFDKTEIAKEAVKDAVETIGYTSVDSGAYTVVFSNKVMASLLSVYSSIFSAEAAQKGLSLLKDKEGEIIASDIVTLTDDPLYKDALAKATFDDEGASTYTKNIIENGKFTTFLHNLATAAKAGVKTTGNGYKASYSSPVGINHYSFYINPVKGSLEDLFAEAGNGIYITSVEGMHAGADPISGDFSLSSGGFRIEDGKKSTPVKGITISGNFLDIMKNISSIGEDLKFNPFVFGAHRCGSPSVLVKGINIAGK